MNNYLAKLIKQYDNRGLLLDSVLFVLLVVGTYNPKLIGTDKRLATYTHEDFDLLFSFVKLFKKLITIPNVLTEVSNLSGHLFKTDFPNKFAQYIDLMDEHHVAAKKICRSDLFHDVGVTDTTIADLAKDRYLVLTDDLRLVGKLEKRSIDVINFNHIRVLAWR